MATRTGSPGCLQAILLSAALLGLAGCEAKQADTAPAGPATAVPAPVQVATAASPSASATGGTSGDPVDYSTVGPLVVEQQAEVSVERDGFVTSVRAELGEHVHMGQVLALLDDRSNQAAYSAKAAHLESLHAQVREWEAEQKGNEADLRRADAMLADKIISVEDEEHVKYKLEETIAEVARYKAEASATESDLRSISIDIEESRILSPLSGVVGRRSVRNFQEVKKGDQLFWVTAEAPLHIVFTVPESAMAAFSIGAKLELSTPVYPQLLQAATVLHVSPVVDPASGSVEVVGLLLHPSAQLKPGMSMKVRLGAE